MLETFDELISEYHEATTFRNEREATALKRSAMLPSLQSIIQNFIQERTNLQTFRDQLGLTLRANNNPWGIQGGFMMELNKLVKHHDEHAPIAETMLRKTLKDLSVQNLGQRIEQFYNFIVDERKRLRKEGKTPNMAMYLGNTAFIISLFAYWLNYTKPPVIYYQSTCQGMYELMARELLANPGGINMDNQGRAVVVRNQFEHLAFMEGIHALTDSAPTAASDASSIENFMLWVQKKFSPPDSPTIIKEPDHSTLLSPTSSQNEELKESPSLYDFVILDEFDLFPLSLPSEPLQPVEKTLLEQRIREVQQSILVNEFIIRRIYHALLAGHVILTGPPGTGKTELARIIPEILWKNENELEQETKQGSTWLPTSYTTRLVTATDEWSARTLIGGITPRSSNGSISYGIQYGYLTTTILNNWSFDPHKPQEWNSLRRTPVSVQGFTGRGTSQVFRGQWLVIDEFNRAPIDLALGDALTALSGNDVLRVPIEEGSAELPIPPDFRVIGTLNSFDRNYLNQISEALKRRFSFIEILPPTRAQRAVEQGVVLYKALKRISHLTNTISIEEEGTLYWQGVAAIGFDPSGLYSVLWDDKQQALREVFETAWRIFETIRIYRQLGTAQAITLIRSMLIAGILQEYTTREAWMGALDVALCDTLADQLQVLLPDEVEALLLYLTTDRAGFSDAYQRLLTRLSSTPQRLYGQLLSLSSVSDGNGRPLLTDEEVEEIAGQNQPIIPAAKLAELFQPGQSASKLPQFTRRLRAFKAERGL